jgi:hypothetical protein
LFGWAPGPSGDEAASSRGVAGEISPDDNPFLVRMAPAGPVAPAGLTAKAVQFEVLQVQAPLGEFSRSQKIWDHLDEQAVGIDTQMLLQRNGLRVGLGSPESWPPVRTILETVERRIVRQMPASMPNSVSVSLEIDNEPQDQTVFFYRANGTLAGGSFAGATDVFRINWEFDPDNLDRTVVYITPEVRQDQSGVSFKATPLGVAPVPIHEGKVFRELTTRVVVSPGSYIVLGPAEDVTHTGLLGREFLVSEIDGELYETILMIVPRVLELKAEREAEGTGAAAQRQG